MFVTGHLSRDATQKLYKKERVLGQNLKKSYSILNISHFTCLELTSRTT